VVRGGDLDNRLKTLLDALRMPLAAKEVPGPQWGVDDPSPYCLLEDDSLVSRISIDTKRLRTRPTDQQGADYAELVVDASIVALRRHLGTQFGFLRTLTKPITGNGSHRCSRCRRVGAGYRPTAECWMGLPQNSTCRLATGEDGSS
jgi:hypothetical protein